MNQVLRFTKLDLRVQQATLKTTLAVAAVLVLLTWVTAPLPEMIVAVFTFAAAIVAVEPFRGDERGRLDTLYAVLPVSRALVVWGRYLTILGIQITFAATGVLLAFTAAAVKAVPMDTPPGWDDPVHRLRHQRADPRPGDTSPVPNRLRPLPAGSRSPQCWSSPHSPRSPTSQNSTSPNSRSPCRQPPGQPHYCRSPASLPWRYRRSSPPTCTPTATSEQSRRPRPGGHVGALHSAKFDRAARGSCVRSAGSCEQ